MYEALKQTKLDLNQLQHLLRARNVFSIREVEYAILETDGTVSVMKKAPFEQPTRQDQNISASEATLPVTVIIDGEVIWDNIRENGWNEQWLQKHIRHAGFENYSDILYAEWKKEKECTCRHINVFSLNDLEVVFSFVPFVLFSHLSLVVCLSRGEHEAGLDESVGYAYKSPPFFIYSPSMKKLLFSYCMIC